MTPGGNAFDVVCSMTQHVPGCDELRAATISHTRLVRTSDDATCSNDLLELDEAVEVLGRGDHKVVKNEQQSIKRAIDQRLDSAQAFNKKFVEVAPKKKDCSSKKTVELQDFPDVVAQSEARNHCQPNG